MGASLIFLLAAVGASALGIFVLWAAQQRPAKRSSSIDDFRQGLDALAPPGHDAPSVPSVHPVEFEPGED